MDRVYPHHVAPAWSVHGGPHMPGGHGLPLSPGWRRPCCRGAAEADGRQQSNRCLTGGGRCGKVVVAFRSAAAAGIPLPACGTLHGDQEDVRVGQKAVRFSDLSGQLITEDDAPARIVVREPPELADGPVEIEALAAEARAIEQAGLGVAVVDVCLPGDDEPRRVVIDVEEFGKLATDTPMSELLTTARPARRAPRPAAAATVRGDRPGYATLEHAGKPHKGKTTAAEHQLFTEHFDWFDHLLAAHRHRLFIPSPPGYLRRYGLPQPPPARGSAPD